MKTATILSLVLAASSLHAMGVVPSPTADDPRERTGQQVEGGQIIVKGKVDQSFQGHVIIPGDVQLSLINLDRDFLESPPGNLVRAELEAANGEND